MKQRYNYIDRLKGFAILSVIMGHLILQRNIIYESISSFHMPLFIFLSGLVASIPSINNISDKFRKLLFPFFIVGTCHVLLLNVPFISALQSTYKAGYWYLYVLFCFYIFLVPFGWNKNKYFKGLTVDFIIAIIIFCILFVFKIIYNPTTSNDLFSICQLIQYWPFFILGFFVKKFDVISKVNEHSIIYGIALVLYITFFVLYINGCASLYKFMAIMAITCLIYLFYSREHFNSVFEDTLARFGKGSLDIYIFHFFILKSLNIKAIDYWFNQSGNILFELIFLVFLSIIIAYICLNIGKLIRISRPLSFIVYGELQK